MNIIGNRLQIFLICICIMGLIYLVYKMKVRRVDVKYTMPWLLLDILMMIIAAFPEVVVWGCRIVGIQVASNAVFFAALVFLLVIVYLLSRAVSRLNNEVRMLSQRIALDEIKEAEDK
ncbi:MAG: DUF2304 domain-containing protein [Lachnospiraceae bacterium]|nr:DUF2304 domain-containing protein [Lachnospiraceae bacterium]